MALCCVVALPQTAFAVDRVWAGGASAAWGTKQNWSGNTTPGNTDNALFNSVFTLQPGLGTTAATVGGLWFTGNIGQDVTISGSGAGILTLSGNTINGTTGLGILMDNANAFTLTINAAVALGAAQKWSNNSANLLTIGAGGLNLNGKALTVNGSGDTTVSGIVSGSSTYGTLTKVGTGTLSLTGTNSFVGQLTVQAGTLSIATINNASTAGSLGNSTLAVAIGSSGNTGTLEYTGTAATASSTKKFSLTLGGSGAFQVDNAGTALSLNGVISGSGSLVKTGAGVLVLGAVNTYTGTTTVNGGTLKIEVANALPNTAVTVSGAGTGAATLDLQSFIDSIGSLTLGGATATSTATVTGSGTLTLLGSVTYDATSNPLGATISLGALALGASQTFTVGDSSNADADLTVSSVISGSAFGITKAGAGTLLLSGANTYTGTTTISGGTLQLGDGTAGHDGTINNSLSVVNNGALVYNRSGSDSFAGVISGTGTLTKTGAGTQTLTGTNTFTGSTTVSGGSLILASAGSALGATSSITVNSGGTLMLGASNQINNNASVSLAGGTFAKGNFSEGTATTPGMGALTLTTAGSHLDFGTGTVGVLNFASFTPGLFTLTIDNWTGTANTVGSGATDRLIFDTTQLSNLASFSFTGFGPGATQFDLGNGYYEVTPIVAAPEPSTYAAAALGALSLAGHFLRRRRTARK